MTEKQSRTATQIFLKGFKEPYLRSSERPFIKLLNWYTGIGKTYNEPPRVSWRLFGLSQAATVEA